MPTPTIEIYPPPDKRRRPPTPRVAFEAAPTKWSGALPDKFIATLVELVSAGNLTGWINDLSQFHTRHTLSGTIGSVTSWVQARFQAFGYSDVAKYPYTRDGHNLHNVVCTKPGSAPNASVILICAHFDCRRDNLNDATGRAPGADDNATGMAAMLEVARLLADVNLRDTVQFVAFSGEEQGMWGSTDYAEHVKNSGVNLQRLINLDMIGVPSADGAILIEQDDAGQAGNNQASQQLAAAMAQLAADYTSRPVQLGSVYGSDYVPFEARGYVVVGAYESGENPAYHTGADVATGVDVAYVADIVRVTLATVLQLAADVVDESTSTVDLYIRDSAGDTGLQPSGVPHWTSPDIWVRHKPPPADPTDTTDPNYGEDPLAGHQNPINGVPNYLYARVHNRGSAPAPATGLAVTVYHCDPGTGMIWPQDFQKMGTLPVGSAVPAGGDVVVGPFIWTPQIVDHECLLAIVSGPGDHAVPDVYGGALEHSLLVRYDNNIGQRNVAPQAVLPGGKTEFTWLLRGAQTASTNALAFDAGEFPADTVFFVRLARSLADAATINGFTLEATNSRWTTLRLTGGVVGVLAGFPLEAGLTRSVAVTIDFSYQAAAGARYPLVMTQTRDGLVAGRMTVEVVAVKEAADYVYGNPRSMELHTIDCPFWDQIAQHNKRPFMTIEEGVARGYNGCRFCLQAWHTD